MSGNDELDHPAPSTRDVGKSVGSAGVGVVGNGWRQEELTMTKVAFDRDGILDPDERKASAKKCLSLLLPEVDSMGEREVSFVTKMSEKIDQWGVSERQLAWLRDLVGKYAN